MAARSRPKRKIIQRCLEYNGGLLHEEEVAIRRALQASIAVNKKSSSEPDICEKRESSANTKADEKDLDLQHNNSVCIQRGLKSTMKVKKKRKAKKEVNLASGVNDKEQSEESIEKRRKLSNELSDSINRSRSSSPSQVSLTESSGSLGSQRNFSKQAKVNCIGVHTVRNKKHQRLKAKGRIGSKKFHHKRVKELTHPQRGKLMRQSFKGKFLKRTYPHVSGSASESGSESTVSSLMSGNSVSRKVTRNAAKRDEKILHAQRKFASVQPQNSLRISVQEEDIPTSRAKAEDFLTFLCLRGHPSMPKELDIFSSPCTPLSPLTEDEILSTPSSPSFSEMPSSPTSSFQHQTSLDSACETPIVDSPAVYDNDEAFTGIHAIRMYAGITNKSDASEKVEANRFTIPEPDSEDEPMKFPKSITPPLSFKVSPRPTAPTCKTGGSNKVTPSLSPVPGPFMSTSPVMMPSSLSPSSFVNSLSMELQKERSSSPEGSVVELPPPPPLISHPAQTPLLAPQAQQLCCLPPPLLYIPAAAQKVTHLHGPPKLERMSVCSSSSSSQTNSEDDDYVSNQKTFRDSPPVLTRCFPVKESNVFSDEEGGHMLSKKSEALPSADVEKIVPVPEITHPSPSLEAGESFANSPKDPPILHRAKDKQTSTHLCVRKDCPSELSGEKLKENSLNQQISVIDLCESSPEKQTSPEQNFKCQKVKPNNSDCCPLHSTRSSSLSTIGKFSEQSSSTLDIMESCPTESTSTHKNNMPFIDLCEQDSSDLFRKFSHIQSSKSPVLQTSISAPCPLHPFGNIILEARLKSRTALCSQETSNCKPGSSLVTKGASSREIPVIDLCDPSSSATSFLQDHTSSTEETKDAKLVSVSQLDERDIIYTHQYRLGTSISVGTLDDNLESCSHSSFTKEDKCHNGVSVNTRLSGNGDKFHAPCHQNSLFTHGNAQSDTDSSQTESLPSLDHSESPSPSHSHSVIGHSSPTSSMRKLRSGTRQGNLFMQLTRNQLEVSLASESSATPLLSSCLVLGERNPTSLKPQPSVAGIMVASSSSVSDKHSPPLPSDEKYASSYCKITVSSTLEQCVSRSLTLEHCESVSSTMEHCLPASPTLERCLPEPCNQYVPVSSSYNRTLTSQDASVSHLSHDQHVSSLISQTSSTQTMAKIKCPNSTSETFPPPWSHLQSAYGISSCSTSPRPYTLSINTEVSKRMQITSSSSYPSNQLLSSSTPKFSETLSPRLSQPYQVPKAFQGNFPYQERAKSPNSLREEFVNTQNDSYNNNLQRCLEDKSMYLNRLEMFTSCGKTCERPIATYDGLLEKSSDLERSCLMANIEKGVTLQMTVNMDKEIDGNRVEKKRRGRPPGSKNKVIDPNKKTTPRRRAGKKLEGNNKQSSFPLDKSAVRPLEKDFSVKGKTQEDKPSKDPTPKKKVKNDCKPSPKPKLAASPILRPSEEEFKDPVEYLQSVEPALEKFGICIVEPPESWKPESHLPGNLRFNSQCQLVHRLKDRWGPVELKLACIEKHLKQQQNSVLLAHMPQIGGLDVDLMEISRVMEEFGGMQKVIDSKKWTKVADMLRIPKAAQDRIGKLQDIYCKYLLSYDLLPQEEKAALEEQVKEDIEQRVHDGCQGDRTESDSECVRKGHNLSMVSFQRIARNTQEHYFKSHPSAGDVEREYWKIVQSRERYVSIHQAKVDTEQHGSCFPVGKTNPYAKSGWNLNVLPHLKGSLLRHAGNVEGLSVPWLNVDMIFSTDRWRVHSLDMYTIDFLHSSADKVWYGVPEADMDRFPESRISRGGGDGGDAMVSPSNLLRETGLTVTRLVQKQGQFVVVSPKAYHCTISCGYSVSEAVAFAFPSWLLRVTSLHKDVLEDWPSFPYDKMVIGMADEIMNESQEVLECIHRELTRIRQKEASLRKELRELGVSDAGKTKQATPNAGTKGSKEKSGSVQIDSCELYCGECDWLCAISAVVCEEEPETLCLKHAVDFLRKGNPSNGRKMVFSYTLTEIDDVITAINEKLHQMKNTS